jgi:hypothetical protein
MAVDIDDPAIIHDDDAMCDDRWRWSSSQSKARCGSAARRAWATSDRG